MGSLGSSWSSRSTLSGLTKNSTPTGPGSSPLLGQSLRIVNPNAVSAATAPQTQVPAPAAPALTSALRDQVVSRQFSTANPSAVLHQPHLTPSEAPAASNELSSYLNNEEIAMVKTLQPQLKAALLAVNPSAAKGEVRTQMVQVLKTLVNDLVPSGNVRFSGSGQRDWDLSDLLSLANAVQRMPLAQRNQLKDITFERAARAELPEGAPDNLFTRVAQEMTAGHYNLEEKKVTLYDRATHTDFPALSPALQSSLRQVATQGKNSDISALQTMLNP